MSDEGQDRNAEVYMFTPAPPPPPKRQRPGRSRLTKTAAGLVVVLGTGAGAAAVTAAATGAAPAALASTSATTTTVPGSGTAPSPGPAAALPRWRGGPMWRGAMRGSGLFSVGAVGVVHGTYTVKGPTGTYETLSTQRGTVQQVSSSSITVKSADGFTQTYAVAQSTNVDANYNGILSVKQGDSITVEGMVDGSTVTAQQVVDLTQVRANRAGWLPPGPGPDGGPGAPPAA